MDFSAETYKLKTLGRIEEQFDEDFKKSSKLDFTADRLVTYFQSANMIRPPNNPAATKLVARITEVMKEPSYVDDVRIQQCL